MDEEKKEEIVEETVPEEEVKEETKNAETPVEEPEVIDETEVLKKKVGELENQVAILKNEYAKAYADTENMRKRLQKDSESFKKYHIQRFALEILPVLDNCERALSQKTSDEAYQKGVEMIYNQLKAALGKEGVEEIDAKGKPFDANWHQALVSVPEEGVEPGIVIEVLQKGYKLKDRLLRAAMVKVSE